MHHISVRVVALAAALGATTGCAIQYTDTKTGAQHIWGFGHMVMRAAPPVDGKQAVATGTDVVGLGLGVTTGGGFVVLGWNRERRVEIVSEDAVVRLNWPSADLIDLQIGEIQK